MLRERKPEAAEVVKKVQKRKARTDFWPAMLFLLPNLLGFACFTMLPTVFSAFLSVTNWSLKPSVELEFLGLRNFADLLWVIPRSDGLFILPTLFYGFGMLGLLGLAGLVKTVLSRQPGKRVRAAFTAVLGALAIGYTLTGAHHVFFITGVILVLTALADNALEKRDQLPSGWWPVPVLGVALGGLVLLYGPTWENYQLRDPRFWQYLYNTLYLMLGIPFSIAGSLGLALLLKDELDLGRRGKWRKSGLPLLAGVILGGTLWAHGMPDLAVIVALLFLVVSLGIAFDVIAFRTLFYLPTFTSGVAIMILWKALYNPQTGFINTTLSDITGIPVDALPEWLASVAWAKPAIMIMGFWIGVGGMNMLLYLAALTNIPKELLEAAEMDGANRWQRFLHVTWPYLRPTTLFVTIITTIWGLQGGFEQARTMTQGGPAGATTTLSYYLYNIGFQDLDLGYASAISWVLFAMIFMITALNWKLNQEKDIV